MENTGDVLPRSRRPGYGPVAPSGRPATPLSRQRSALLETLRSQTAPVTLAALARLSGLHVNTVREHLDGLVRHGLARRELAEPSGRGRPAWLYAAAQVERAPAEYAGLAAALAASIHRTSDTPTQDAADAGSDWGQRLVRERGVRPAENPAAVRREVVALLDDLGFGARPDADAADVRLTRCPLLEAAYQYPDVVCGVHLGLVHGALTAYGLESDDAELLPFAEPGACLLRLGPTR